MKRQHIARKPLDLVLVALLVVLPIITFYVIISLGGPSWDMIARYLNGRTLLNFIASGAAQQHAFSGEYLNSLRYYFEPYREPLSTPIFAVLEALFGSPILIYMIVVFLAYVAAAYVLGRDLGISTLIMLSAMISAYSIFFFFVPNGGEGLAVVFVLLGLVYLLRNNPVAGLFLGMAAIAKYPALVLLPMILLLWNRKKVLYAAILAALPVVLWGLIDYVLYGVPFYSYFASASYSNVVSAPSSINLLAVLAVVVYPVALSCIGILGVLIKRHKLGLRLDYTTKVICAFVLLSLIGYIAILPHNDQFTQMRYGFLFAASLMVASAVIVGRAVQGVRYLKYAAAGLALAVAIGTLGYFIYAYSTAQVTYYNPGSGSSIYAHAGKVLQGLGFAGCRIVSNAWIPMLYAGYDAYSPYILYNDSQQLRYPVVVFNYVGVQMQGPFIVTNLTGAKTAYNDSNMTVYLPVGVHCYNYTEPYVPGR